MDPCPVPIRYVAHSDDAKAGQQRKDDVVPRKLLYKDEGNNMRWNQRRGW